LDNSPPSVLSFVLNRRPASAQAGSRRKYQDALRIAAEQRAGVGPTAEKQLYARILWFHRYDTSQDIDNIVKPILDALGGIWFHTDFQIAQCLATRIDIRETYEVVDTNMPDEVYDNLLALLNSAEADILYVEVGPIAWQRVVFGPIDGGHRDITGPVS
jgi:hypothetical protein